MTKISAIIPAAGSGSRFSKDKNKLTELLLGKPVIVHTLEKIASIEEINNIIICTTTDLIEEINAFIKEYKINKISKVILGGETRQESVYKGLKNCDNPELILIHDAARPLIDVDTIKKSIETAKSKGATIVAVPSKDTIKKTDASLKVIETPDRNYLWNVQTPQVFKYNELLKAHNEYKSHTATDDAALIEKLGVAVYITQGKYNNIKITTPEDIALAQILLKTQ